MNAFQTVRPRGKYAPSKAPRKTNHSRAPQAGNVHLLLDSNGRQTVSLERRPSGITIENREQKLANRNQGGRMTSIAIAIADVVVRQDSKGRYNLNDFHRAAGEENRHRPSLWAENQQAKDLAEGHKCIDAATYEFLTNKHAHVMRVAPQLIWESEE